MVLQGLAYNPSAITDSDIDVYTSHISGPGGLKGAFDHFRAFPTDALQNKESATHKITIPVLVLGGDIYPVWEVIFLATLHWNQLKH